MTNDEVYLRHILESLKRIEAYTAEGREGFMRNVMAQDATVRNLEVVGEATKNLSSEFRLGAPGGTVEEHGTVARFLIHGYMGVDLEIVWDVVENRLAPLRSQISALLEPHDPER